MNSSKLHLTIKLRLKRFVIKSILLYYIFNSNRCRRKRIFYSTPAKAVPTATRILKILKLGLIRVKML